MIRYFNEEDIQSIYELGMQITSNFKKTNDLNKLLNDAYTKILVYENDKKLIGFLMYTELTDTVDILDIIVEEESRKKNIASCLLDYMFTELPSTIKLLTLEVRKSNVPAINLYEKFGFSVVNTRKNYYENEDAYLMGRRIGE